MICATGSSSLLQDKDLIFSKLSSVTGDAMSFKISSLADSALDMPSGTGYFVVSYAE
jgi:hypothetical protein